MNMKLFSSDINENVTCTLFIRSTFFLFVSSLYLEVVYLAGSNVIVHCVSLNFSVRSAVLIDKFSMEKTDTCEKMVMFNYQVFND